MKIKVQPLLWFKVGLDFLIYLILYMRYGGMPYLSVMDKTEEKV